MKSIIPIIFLLLFTVSLSGQEHLEVFFDFNKSDINQSSRQKLESWIVEHEDVEVIKIYGFCDWKGTNQYNDTLSIQRVLSVSYFLEDKGIEIKENYEIKGFGEDFKQSKIQAENRKVIIFFQEKQKNQTFEKKSDIDKSLNEKIKEAKVGDVLILKNIYFKNRSAVIVPKSQPVLFELLCILEDNPKLKIQIQGHICCQLENDFEGISTARARAVYVFLVRNKINRKRLSYKGFGISKPIHPIPEKSEQEEDENRRVEIRILEN
jgi:outer membrane protein OmpA-like peptidoglycan-associated protein